MKKIITVIALLISSTAMAHTGHGDASLFAHDLEHALGYVGLLILVAMGIYALRKYR
jgi:hypothetical protein